MRAALAPRDLAARTLVSDNDALRRRSWIRRTLAALREHLPELLVLLSLVGIVPITLWELRSVRSLLTELNHTIEPSTRAAAALQLALAEEAAATRAFLLTGDPAYTEEFHQARATRRSAIQELDTLSLPEVVGFGDVLRDATRQLAIADGFLDGLHAGTVTPHAYLAEFPRQHGRFSSVIAAAATLHQQLRARATADRERIDAIERLGIGLELGALILTFASVISVLRLKGRERAARLASERAKADAEDRGSQLEETTARWSRLIRGFCHDLKNPLNAAQGYLFMLEKGVFSPLTATQVNAIAKSRHSVETAIALTVDLVDLARTQAAGVDVRRTEVNLCDLVGAVVEDYQGQAVAKGLAVALDLPPSPERLQSNAARVTQILGNLVSNAVKYTTTGSISIRVGRRMDVADRDCLVVDVSDTGPGIAMDDHRRVFHEFERLDTGSAAGVGIGLAISEQLAQTLGGAITLDSELGRGSTFTLWLPRTGPGEDAAAEAPSVVEA